MKELLNLFYIFFKLGLFTFGGGYAMIPQIKEIIVEKNKWLSEDEMLEIIAIAESTPGPIAVNMATYIGYLRKKFWGSFFATLGVILPSFIIIFLISLVYKQFASNKYVQYAFVGIKAAVAFLIVKAGINMVVKMKKKAIPVIVLCLVIALMILFEIFSVNFSSIFLILIGGVIGIFTNIVFKIKKKENEEVC